MSDILEELKKYFQETSHEKIISDWEKSEKYDAIGPPIMSFIDKTNFFYRIQEEKFKENILKSLKNPNYSDFCVLINY